MCVEGEVCVTGDREGIDRQSVQKLRGLNLRWRRPRSAEFRQTIRDEEDEDNQGAVSRALDLEVSEEGVGAEEIERLVDYVGLGGISDGRWSANPGPEREDRHVSDLADVGLLIERRMVCGHG